MILIVGCGFLGSYLARCASSKTDEPILATIRDTSNIIPVKNIEYVKCDVTEKSDLTSLAERCGNEPLTVFYFAACHNIDYVFANPEAARKINVEALKSFFEIMPNIKKFFFASTDCVYGEGNGNVKFTEASLLSPVNEYGRQKAEAESIVISEGFTVLRLPFMLGQSLAMKLHFYDNINSKLSRREAVEMIDGMKRSVLSYKQTAELIYSLSSLSDGTPQIINVCSDTELSKYEIGCILARKLNASVDLIKSISEEEGKKFFKDKRASCTAMDNSLIKELLGIEKIVWEESEQLN